MILIMTIFLVIKLCQEPMTPGYVNVDKTRQDNVLFGVLYSPMYIDFIHIIYPNVYRLDPNNLMYV